MPSELYLKTNEKLIKLLFHETGEWATPTTCKVALVKRIERNRAIAAAEAAHKKRGRENEDETGKKPRKKT